jgi:hypothetical protein
MLGHLYLSACAVAETRASGEWMLNVWERKVKLTRQFPLVVLIM